MAILMMPVSYRGGADHAHAHAVFDLLIGAARDSIRHHEGDHHDAGGGPCHLVETLVDMPSTLSALGNAPATIILFAAFAALSALARHHKATYALGAAPLAGLSMPPESPPPQRTLAL